MAALRSWRTTLRILPSVFVAALIVVVARAQPGSMHVAAIAVDPTCVSGTASSVTVTAVYGLAGRPSMTIVQPGLGVTLTADAGYVFVQRQSTIVQGQMILALFDPTAPDPLLGTYPMYISTTPVSTSGWIGSSFGRTLVVRSVQGVAQPTGGDLAISVVIQDPSGSGGAGYDPASVTLTASALDLTILSQPAPLPGPSPRLAHVLCRAVGDSDRLRVAQQVLRVSEPLPLQAEIIQTFGVPVTITAERVELALPTIATAMPIEVSILEPANPTPGNEPLPVTTTSAVVDVGTGPGTVSVPAWVPSQMLGASAFLVPGRTYWLTLKVRNAWTPGADVSTGGSGYPAGRLYMRQFETMPFTENQGADLSFRIIGRLAPLQPPPICATQVVYAQPSVNASAIAQGGAPIGQHTDRIVAGLAHYFYLDESGVIRFNTTPTATVGESAIGGLPTQGVATAPIVPMADTYPLAHPSTLVNEGNGWWRMSYPRLLVTETVTGTAHTSSPGFVQVFEPAPGDPPLVFGYHTDAPASVTVTAAVQYTPIGWQVLPGSNPVLAMEVCADPEAATNASLRVVQQVLKVTGEPLAATTTAEVVQTFRVPERVMVSWAEMAVPGTQTGPATMVIKILDPGTLTIPPPDPLSVTNTAEVQTFTFHYDGSAAGTPGVWVGSISSQGLPLDPGRDYWLLAKTNNVFSLGTDNVTTTAYVEGKLFVRGQTSGPFTELPQDLSFRLIGRPIGPIDVSLPPPSDGLSFAGGPNPFRGEYLLRWRGGTGRLRLAVRDLAGRVVRREIDVGAAVDGQWRWRGDDDRGRRVPAGVYFIHVRGPDGRPAINQIAFLR